MRTELGLCAETRERMERYRKRLLAAGLQSPEMQNFDHAHWLFFAQKTADTAFVVNLKGRTDGIEIAYGYASTANMRMAGDGGMLERFGINDEAINLREGTMIYTEADELPVGVRIQAMHDQYQFTAKDELLNCAKAKRKKFIDQISAELKPMGFRKKSNLWTRTLESGCRLIFYAQKSSFSDEYYFNIYIGKDEGCFYGECFYMRIAPNGLYPMDWQTVSQELWGEFLRKQAVFMLERLICTPLHELGKAQDIWTHCACNREKCETCWVEKNLWEAQSS